MGDLYQIWTVQMARVRHIKDPEIHPLDTTAKSGTKEFAPHFNDVMRYKDGFLSENQYTDIYLRKMRDSQQQFPSVWKRLLKHKKVAVICYCTPGKFCHRHLFAPLMKKYLEDQGHQVKLMGELNGPNYAPMPESIVSIPREQKIIPFYGKEDLLSNHNPSGFLVKGVWFDHGEQFLMYCKSKLMGDHVTAERILKEKNPQGCKMLGRAVTPWDETLWKLKRRGIMNRGCYEKAKQNPHVDEYLLSTDNHILVEASGSDRNWGVGISKDDPRIYDMNQWQGLNLLGESWMWARRKRQEEIIF